MKNITKFIIFVLLCILLYFLCETVKAERLAVTPGQSVDDGWENLDGTLDVAATYIEFVWDYDRRYGAIRYPNITISQGATIDSSYMKIWEHSTGSHDNAYDTIACFDVDSAQAINGSDAYFMSERWSDSITTAKVYWEQYINNDLAYTRMDVELKTLIQEIVNRESWKSGNAIMFLFKNISDSDIEIWTWDHAIPTETVESLIVYYTADAPPAEKRILWRKND